MQPANAKVFTVGNYEVGLTRDLPATDPIHANPNALPFYVYQTVDGYIASTFPTFSLAMQNACQWSVDEDEELEEGE
jgi:hypothetical protein